MSESRCILRASENSLNKVKEVKNRARWTWDYTGKLDGISEVEITKCHYSTLRREETWSDFSLQTMTQVKVFCETLESTMDKKYEGANFQLPSKLHFWYSLLFAGMINILEPRFPYALLIDSLSGFENRLYYKGFVSSRKIFVLISKASYPCLLR
jgi:hypothetical protein